MTGAAVAFLGPSLSERAARALGDFDLRPPVAQGDVYRAALERPRVIAIVDGFFEGVPAVWHKEILWALSRGIAVVGGGSMGALRAAELHSFGMEGVGPIFEWFRDGMLHDDDEVAVAHGPPETGYVLTSEAMVNVRATLEAARAAGVLDEAARATLAAIAKRIFYKERSWDRVLAAAAGVLDPGSLAAFADWLATGRVDQKRRDAEAVLRRATELLDAPASAPAAPGAFEITELWQRGIERFAAEAPVSDAEARILDHARRDADRFHELRRAAALRLIAAKAGSRESPARETIRRRDRFRLARGLVTRDALADWLATNHAGPRDLDRLAGDEVAVDDLLSTLGPRLDRALVDELRARGLYAALLARPPAGGEPAP